MPIRQKLPKSTLVAITTDSAAGSSHRDLLMKYPDVSDRTLRVLRMNGVNVEEWRSEVARGLRDAVEETIAAYRTALAAGKIPPNNLSLSAAILIDKADKLDARHVAGAVPLPPPAKRDPVVELRSHPGLSANLLPQSGCPTTTVPRTDWPVLVVSPGKAILAWGVRDNFAHCRADGERLFACRTG